LVATFSVANLALAGVIVPLLVKSNLAADRAARGYAILALHERVAGGTF
jgi:hypothetical protein